MFKPTIKAKTGYLVKKAHNNRDGREWYLVFDGDELIMFAYPLTLNEHNYHLENNECYHVCERFTTRKGTKFVYARDEEDDVDYLIRV